jgi:hypothetical protein
MVDEVVIHDGGGKRHNDENDYRKKTKTHTTIDGLEMKR